MARITTIPAATLGANQVRQFLIPGHPPIALYNVDGSFFATDDLCTHGEASLSEGDIDGDEIICPFHLGAFDIRSGEASKAPCNIAVRTYAVHVDGNGMICVEID